MIDLCDALYEIHSLDPPIIHRDIKPLNVMITNYNILKLIDFDISRTYKEGEKYGYYSSWNKRICFT